MGLVRNSTRVITFTPNLAADSVAATTAYADKDVIGDHMTISNAVLDMGGTSLLQSVMVRNKTTTAFAMVIYIMDTAPASSYGANNSALAIDDTDLMNVIQIVSIAATDWDASGSLNSVAFKDGMAKPVQCVAGSRDLYAIFIARGAVTFGAAGDLQIDMGFLQD